MRHVTGVELIQAVVPRAQYNVESHNNTLTVRVGNTFTTVSVPKGNYTICTLCDALNAAIQPTHTSFKAKYLPLKEGVELKMNTAFILVLQGDNASTLVSELGFDPESPNIVSIPSSSGAEYTVTSTQRVDMSGPRFVRITTDELTHQHHEGVLADILLQDVINYYDVSSTKHRRFEAPVDIKFLTLNTLCRHADGTTKPYTLNGLNIELSLEISYHRPKNLSYLGPEPMQ